jgi:hypothetical protein
LPESLSHWHVSWDSDLLCAESPIYIPVGFKVCAGLPLPPTPLEILLRIRKAKDWPSDSRRTDDFVVLKRKP